MSFMSSYKQSFRYSVQATHEKGMILLFVPILHKKKKYLILLFVCYSSPIFPAQDVIWTAWQIAYLSKQFLFHMTRISIIVLCFMLSGSQEGIVLDPETLLSSSIQVKEDIKTCYIGFFQLKSWQIFLPNVFEDNLCFIFFQVRKQKMPCLQREHLCSIFHATLQKYSKP